MAYGEGIPIKKMIKRIESREYVLPSIQREFVWDMDQIARLFDSLMRDYPINTFLFWKLDGENVNKFQLYGFLHFYHERDKRHNDKLDLSDRTTATAILDGQQRMTSLYLGLKGSYSKRKRGGRKNDPSAYIERKLYLNLLKKSDVADADYDDMDDDEAQAEYEFKFLTDTEAKSKKNGFWFECGKMLDFQSLGDVISYLDKIGLIDKEEEDYEKNIKFSRDILSRFFEVVHKDRIIRYYLEESEELNKVLQIFIRTNNAGTVLSHSDLLFSMVTANWGERDAREVINDFVDSINSIGDGFSFNKDVVLKACLVLCDGNVKFKVDNFDRKKMSEIENNWDVISEAIMATVKLVSRLGYNNTALRSKNAIIPIAYYLYKNNIKENDLLSSHHRDSVKCIKEWLARVLLSGSFGGSGDSIYPPLRDIINNNIKDGKDDFPLQKIIDHYKNRTKSISFSEDEIDNLLELEYSDIKIHPLLTLLYLGVDNSRIYHKDHIHPQTLFSGDNVPEGKFYDFYSKKHKIANLQLLPDVINFEKSGKPFEDWLDEAYSEQGEKELFLSSNYIDIGQSLGFENFLSFYDARKQKIKDKLMHVLGVDSEDSEAEST